MTVSRLPIEYEYVVYRSAPCDLLIERHYGTLHNVAIFRNKFTQKGPTFIQTLRKVLALEILKISLETIQIIK